MATNGGHLLGDGLVRWIALILEGVGVSGFSALEGDVVGHSLTASLASFVK
jgi:hypothetical protein